jgi:hypothetical protein
MWRWTTARSVRAALELSDFSRRPRFERGELRIDAGAAKLPDAPGLAVVANLPRWNPQIPGGPPGTPARSAGRRPNAVAHRPTTANRKPLAPGVSCASVDARIGELVIGGRTFAGVKLQASSAGRRDADRVRWRIPVRSGDRAGRTHAAAAGERRFAALACRPRGRSDARACAPFADVDPRRVPPLVLTVAELRVEEATLGRLRLVAMPRPRRYPFDGHQPGFRPAADRRQRRVVVDRGRPSLQAQSHAAQRSALVKLWRPSVIREAVSIAGKPRRIWRSNGGGLARFRVWSGWRRTLKFQVGPGQLRDINPGLGRMVGMLNVQNLTRRLSFDFSDLFQPGMGFDRISGELAFKRGNAYTDNLLIEAPAARIQIEGRTGLQARDYDQTITVVPHFGGTLPVAGAIAGGPMVGAAVFVAERLLQKGIEHATRYRYTL